LVRGLPVVRYAPVVQDFLKHQLLREPPKLHDNLVGPDDQELLVHQVHRDYLVIQVNQSNLHNRVNIVIHHVIISEN